MSEQTPGELEEITEKRPVVKTTETTPEERILDQITIIAQRHAQADIDRILASGLCLPVTEQDYRNATDPALKRSIGWQFQAQESRRMKEEALVKQEKEDTKHS